MFDHFSMRLPSGFLLFWITLVAALTGPVALAQAPGRAAPSAEAARFDILEFEVEGNSVLGAAAIETAVYRFLGERKTADDVEAARTALEKRYQDAGFLSVFVDIPEQKVEGGLVVLRVTEGTVDRLRVVGSRYFSQGYLKAKVPALAEGEVPYFPDVQAQIAQLNSDDRSVTPVLRAGRLPGTVEAELKVEDRLPLSATLEINNRYSLNTARTRAVASLRFANLWQRDHSAGITYQNTPTDPSQVQVLSANYVFPIPESRAVVALYGVRSDSAVAVDASNSFLGRGDIYGARLIVTLPARGAYSHNLTFGVDSKNFKDTTQLLGADSSFTPIRYLPFSIAYGQRRSAEGANTAFNLAANFHFRGFGDQNVLCNGQLVNAFACRRFGADSNYLYLRGDVSRSQPVGGGWSVFGRLAGQAASQPLISNEQFGAGGAESVRGYAEFERVGDRGLSTSIEVRGPNLVNPAGSGARELGLFAFWDAGWVSFISPLPGTPERYSLASAGFGMRLKGWRALTASLDIGWPLKDGAPRPGVADFNRMPRAHMRVAYDF